MLIDMGIIAALHDMCLIVSGGNSRPSSKSSLSSWSHLLNKIYCSEPGQYFNKYALKCMSKMPGRCSYHFSILYICNYISIIVGLFVSITNTKIVYGCLDKYTQSSSRTKLARFS